MGRGKAIITTTLTAAFIAGVLSYIAKAMNINGVNTQYYIILISVFLAMLAFFKILSQSQDA